MAAHDSSNLIKFADNTMVEGLITDDSETAYREEVKYLAVWCQTTTFIYHMSGMTQMQAVSNTGAGK